MYRLGKTEKTNGSLDIDMEGFKTAYSPSILGSYASRSAYGC
jgi:hypothetical protein